MMPPKYSCLLIKSRIAVQTFFGALQNHFPQPFFISILPRLMVVWDIGGGGVEMVGVRYFSGNRKVRQSGKSREVATLHPTTPPGKSKGWSSSSRRQRQI